MRGRSAAWLTACVCCVLGGCVWPPGEPGQMEWHDALLLASSAVDQSAERPDALFTSEQVRIVIGFDADEVVSIAELLARVPSEDRAADVLTHLADRLDSPGMREALGLEDSTTEPVNEQLAGEFWLYEEPIHFDTPMPPWDFGFYAYWFYVINGKVGAASTVFDWPAAR